MDDIPKTNSVRAMIQRFEGKSIEDTEIRLNRPMSKSFSGLSNLDRTPKISLGLRGFEDNIYKIEQQLAHLILKTKTYTDYNKQVHIRFQNELIEILANLASIDVNNNNIILKKKKELMDIIKMLYEELNDMLPSLPSDDLQKGFGDFAYTAYSPKRPISFGGIEPNMRISPNERKSRPKSVGAISAVTNETVDVRGPLRSLSFQERNKVIPNVIIHQNSMQHSPGTPKSSPTTRSRLELVNRSPEVLEGINLIKSTIIGGQTGIKYSAGNNKWKLDESKKQTENLTSRKSFGDVEIADSMRRNVNDQNEESYETLHQKVDRLRKHFEMIVANDEPVLTNKRTFDVKEDFNDQYWEYPEFPEEATKKDQWKDNSDHHFLDEKESQTEENQFDHDNEQINHDSDELIYMDEEIETQESNQPIFRTKNEGEVLVGENENPIHPDIQESCSVSSEHSIYVDPVD